MNKDVYLFDLDDTIVYYSKRGLTVPRQTWHKLRALHFSATLILVSYNPLAFHIAGRLGLFKYCPCVIVGIEFRKELIAQALAKCTSAHVNTPVNTPLHLQHVHHVYYFDDRLDNIALMSNPLFSCIVISTPPKLYMPSCFRKKRWTLER